MNHNSTQFDAAEIGEKFETNYNKFKNLLSQSGDENLLVISQKLHQELKVYQEDGILRVAFVGQYSAGKSTIISALTGQRDIKIDADIATDTTTSYGWNGIKLIDTPGLFTDRPDHDDITYEAITRADLLVFCLTYMLFDSVTVENFKKLAYDKGYRWKMMLIVNKMSDEAGDEEEKIANYRQSLELALNPYQLNEFPVCFIDAKDYCEGIDNDDDFFLEISRFPTFVNELNNFVERRATLARFDTPVRIVLSYIDEAQIHFIRNSSEDSAFFEILNQLSHKIRRERSRLRTKVLNIMLRMSSSVAKEGMYLATEIGKVQNKEEFGRLNKQAESNIKICYEEAAVEIEKTVKAAIYSLQQEIQNVLHGSLAQAFLARTEVKQKVPAQNACSSFEADSEFSDFNVDPEFDFERIHKQVAMLKSIGEKAGVGIRKLAINGNTTINQGFLSASNVAGSNLHHVVYGFGKFIGFDFAPWQAVNLAKDIANFTLFLGPISGAVSVGMELKAKEQEQEREQKLADARRDITSQFIKVAKEMERQIETQLQQVEAKVYGEIEKQITEARHQEEKAISTSNVWIKQLAEIRQDYEALLQQLT